MMKITILVAFFASFVTAFPLRQASTRSGVSLLFMGYVPDGMTPEQYRKLRQKEAEDAKKKKFGAFGPQSFKSRSLQSFQKDLEKGKTGHLMPVLNAKEKLKKGEIKQADIPYMQRMGSWDDSDIGAKKKWSKYDEKYDPNERPSGVDWMGVNQRAGPSSRAAATKKQAEDPKKKKGGLFGMF